MHLNLYAKLDGVQSLTRKQIDSFLANAPDKYKVYSIPKRSGGERIIAHPAKRLKQFQYHIVDIMEEICEIHPCAMAYTKGKSIKENAFSHAHNQYILKLDFSDFFNSITPEMLFKALTDNNLNVTKAEERVLSKSLFWNKSKTVNSRLALSVGAPSSPLISNIVMYSFDAFFANFCKQHGIHFTRYADDLTFSTNIKGILFKIPDIVRKYLNEYYKNSITLNERKTIFTSKAHNRRVTGITITPLGTLSLGRERKRLISVLIHKYTLGILESDTLSYLQGMLAFAFHIEPAFFESMKRKYSSETIFNLMPIRKKNVESTS